MWILDNINRLNIERSAIDDLIAKSDWLINVDWKFESSNFVLTGEIIISNQAFKIKMVYPPLFPLNPPSVFPVDIKRRLSEHQYGSNGELCLEWRPDNWNESITGADMLISAHKLLSLENQNTNVPQVPIPPSHSLAQGQEVRITGLRFIVHQSTIDYLLTLPIKSHWKVNFNLIVSRESCVSSLRSIDISDKEKWDNPEIPKELENTSIKVEGIYYRNSLPHSDFSNTNTANLQDKLKKSGLDLSPLNEKNNRFLLFSDNEQHFHLISRIAPDNWLFYKTIILSDIGIEARIGKETEALQKVKVGIIGLGSVGSKIAISLARSGVREFFLYDYDLFLPENLCRHELTWDDVGQHKVDGIKHMLCLINPKVNVTLKKIMLAGQEASLVTTSALRQLTECNLIIDATAEPSVFNLLSNVSYQSNIPFLWLEVYEGGIGGFLGRFRPKHEPHPQKMRAFLQEYQSKQVASNLKSAGNYASINPEGDTIVATDSDVSIIAGHATNMSLDILLKREPSIFPNSMYLIGLRTGWIFEQPFSTQPLDPFETDSEIPTSSLTSEDTKENLDFIKKIIDKQAS